MNDLIYLRHSTTAPLDPRVRERMLPWLDEDPHRPGGLLSDGRRAGRAIEEARLHVASLIGAKPPEIVFTSSGTEACNLALKGPALARLARRDGNARAGGILVGATEHPAVLHPARTLAKLGFDLREIPVDRHGVVLLEALDSLTGADCRLVSLAMATAETGTLQPIAAIARRAHEGGALMHADLCLAAANLRVDMEELGLDLASLSAHKMGGPRGVGALYVREGVRLLPLIEGGLGEGGRRAGAEYVAGIAGFGETARLAGLELEHSGERWRGLGSSLLDALMEIPGVSLNGHPQRRLRSLVNVSVEGVEGEAILLKLARRGIAASSGSSCIQETGKPSHVLAAMGVPETLARGSVLFSIGRDNTADEIARVAEAFRDAVATLRGISFGGDR